MSQITLNKDEVNTVILELALISSFVNPFYLFQVISDFSKNEIVYFTGTDLSTFKCRYSRFDVTLSGGTPNYSAATFNLKKGQYIYNVFESSASTLSVSATTGRPITTGRLIVNGIDNSIPPVYR